MARKVENCSLRDDSYRRRYIRELRRYAVSFCTNRSKKRGIHTCRHGMAPGAGTITIMSIRQAQQCNTKSVPCAASGARPLHSSNNENLISNFSNTTYIPVRPENLDDRGITESLGETGGGGGMKEMCIRKPTS
jgi:hypothetical protein